MRERLAGGPGSQVIVTAAAETRPAGCVIVWIDLQACRRIAVSDLVKRGLAASITSTQRRAISQPIGCALCAVLGLYPNVSVIIIPVPHLSEIISIF